MQHQPTAKHTLASPQLFLYRRALHPELFALKQRRTIPHTGYEFETWLMQGGHMLRFQIKGFCASELLTAQDTGLPTSGAVATFPCVGEKDYDHPFPEARVSYGTSMQTETLSENLYNATYNELIDLAKETDALLHIWSEADGPALSMVELQRYPREIHAHAYHMSPSSGLVLRTQSIFELK
jgi:hypothetical protein